MTMTAPATTEAVYNLGHVDQIPTGEGRCFVLGSVPVAVFRSRRGDVYATQARCTHRDGPLADGLIGGETLVCPLHGFKFNLASGEPVGHDCAALETYPVSVSPDGTISVTLRAGEEAAGRQIPGMTSSFDPPQEGAGNPGSLPGSGVSPENSLWAGGWEPTMMGSTAEQKKNPPPTTSLERPTAAPVNL